MLKKIIAAAALVLISLAAQASQLPEYPFIHVSGNGWIYVPPDTGEIDFEVSAYDPAPDAARNVVEARVAEVRALVAGLGLADADVDIRDIRKEFRKPDPAQPGVLGYDIKCSVHIKVRDLAKWKELVSPLLNMPNLAGFMIGFDTSRREQVESELTAQAIKAAQRKAEAIAAGFGRKLGPVNAVSTGDLKNMTRAMGLAAADVFRSRSAPATSYDREGLLMITTMTLSQSVDVIFRIK
jgi:uncharacterized protein YggE